MYNLKIGSKKEQIKKELGDPQRNIDPKLDNHWIYDNGEQAEVESFLHVHFIDGKAVKYVWDTGAH